MLPPVPAELRQRYQEEGHWTPDSLGELIDASLSKSPQARFRVWSQARPYAGSVRDVADLARRVAAGLQARGIGPGDPVAFQLPNWMEAAAAFWGTAFTGAVVVPIVHFYGPREVEFILRQSGARALITVDSFGHLDHLETIMGLRSQLAALETVVVVGSPTIPDTVSFSEFTEVHPIGSVSRVDPESPALIAYTSGTTADPKGVVHTHQTIGAETRQLAEMQRAGTDSARERPLLVGAPVGHAIGMLSALLLPVWRGRPIYLIDAWDPATVLDAMVEAQANAGSGATFFLQSLIDHPTFGPEHLDLLHYVGLGGAAVPPSFAERVTDLGISLVRSYGSTEHPSTTGSGHDVPAGKRLYTDGRPLPGVELRIVDDDGQDVAAGEPGEIWSRGPDRFAGYTDPELTAQALTRDGWYRTGDIAVRDADGFVTITDRKKDIIIRGGENISPAEVEGAILRMPGVAEVAVVAAPDARLGEHGCAMIRLAGSGAAPDLDAVREHLKAEGLARQKWPEEIRVVDDFPRTATGKVRKHVLRGQLRDEATDPGN